MSFTKSKIDEVWEKAIPIHEENPSQKRNDKCGALIAKASYGMETRFGWEIDHIIPVSKNGRDNIENLQPLHWKNNRSKADGSDNPNRYCIVTD